MTFPQETFINTKSYREANALADEVGRQLFDRLSLITIQPTNILVVESKLGWEALKLQEIYPAANIISVDSSFNFANLPEKKNQFVAPLNSLPCAEHSFDFIFANFALTTHAYPDKILKEWQRILKPNGLLLFSGLGANSCYDFQMALSHHLLDMHELGDALAQQFVDPVLDTDCVTLKYRDKNKLVAELTLTQILKPNLPENLQADLPQTLAFEIIYAHAWGKSQLEQRPNEQGEVKFPLNYLRNNNPNKRNLV